MARLHQNCGIVAIMHVRQQQSVKNRGIAGLSPVLLFLICCLFPKVFAQNTTIEDGWKNILPFVTKRDQVEEILGKPQPSTDKIYTVYPTPEGHVAVVYSEKPCSAAPGGKGEYKLEENTVLQYIVTPKTPSPFSELKWKKDHYEPAEDPHHLNVVVYFSRGDGIAITTGIIDGVRIVGQFRFYGSPEQKDHFRCSGTTAPQTP